MTCRALTLIAVAIGCGGDANPPPPPTGTRVGPALVAAIDAAARTRAPWRCSAPDAPQRPPTTITAGKRTWQLAGHTLTSTAGGTFTIGFVADAAGAAPATVAALGRLRAKLEVDLVIALGGMGTTQAELEATLGALVGDVPLIALPGELEHAGALASAVGSLATGGRHVLDGRLLRRIELPGATIATLAGALAPSRLAAGSEGCVVDGAHVADMFATMSSRKGLRILASAGAPRITVDGEPAGDRALVAAAAQQLDVVVHGPVTPKPTGPRTGARDGRAIPLAPGTSDATTRLPPGGEPSAGILTITQAAWRWTPVSAAARP